MEKSRDQNLTFINHNRMQQHHRGIYSFLALLWKFSCRMPIHVRYIGLQQKLFFSKLNPAVVGLKLIKPWNLVSVYDIGLKIVNATYAAKKGLFLSQHQQLFQRRGIFFASIRVKFYISLNLTRYMYRIRNAKEVYNMRLCSNIHNVILKVYWKLTYYF